MEPRNFLNNPPAGKSPDEFDMGSLQLRSESVQEILTQMPHWLVRWGITAAFVAVVMLLVMSWIIKYPQVLTGRITVTTQNPPVRLVARSSGALRLLVADNELVAADRDLAVIENPARLADVRRLRERLQALEQFLANAGELQAVEFDRLATLGELQVHYSSFLQQFLQYDSFRRENYQAQKIAALQQQIVLYRQLSGKSAQQQETLARDAALAKEKFDQAKTLHEKGLISKLELANSESFYLEKKYQLENAAAAALNNGVQLAATEKAIADLRQQFQERSRDLMLALQESYENLLSQLALWEEKYVLKAPAAGRVSFFKFWSDNQFVNNGDEVLTVAPEAPQLVGKVYLSAAGSGKVKTGHKARIKFDRYPFQEYGVVVGEITAISVATHDNSYVLDVSLPAGLRTNYRQQLEFKQEMQGTAEIITEDLRLLERVLYPLRYAVKTSGVME
jgi:HlyD family secretion protein